MNPSLPGTRHDLHRGLDTFETLDAGRIAKLNRFLEEVRRLLPRDREQERYGEAAGAVDENLCCPVEYDRSALAHVPPRILEVDYGCGDPTVYAGPGMTVLDLGSGSGKHAFMIAKTVGADGRVIGVDKTPEMLALSRGAVDEVMQTLEHPEPMVEFRHGHIENLWVDKDRLLAWLDGNALESYEDLERLEAHLRSQPLVPDSSVDLVVSNCVLNLVEDGRKEQLLGEIFRVLKKGGSVAISDIVCDREPTEEAKADADLWTGCLSGAWHRERFMEAFARAGFHGVCETKSWFWKRVGGVNFFSVTVRAFKGKQGPCYETYRQAMYKGPFSQVVDDDLHVFKRGQFVPVCEKTAELLARDPYQAFFHVTPRLEDPAKKIPFDCSPGAAQSGSLSAEQRELLDRLIEEGACCDGENCC